MKVVIDLYKPIKGHFQRVKIFCSQSHLDNYLNNVEKWGVKLVGHHIINN